ncbi:THAP domain-containing protein 5-like [Xenia sp. Carnegie-2017]|uniref:THAP domain-containing protein 5-like n=1 Tax=Xenia sp. Carnegie-2017 TaxID=2897299 RepID=UPI001F0465C8|nr:THAP domain-containing protein 5-like [Xenia sp. Carnegie-2017]
MPDRCKRSQVWRKRWVNFGKATCDKWVPTKNSAVCSEHFTKDSFSRQFGSFFESESKFAPRLIRDEFGIVAYPSIYPRKDDNELTTRDRRMMKRKWMSDYKREVKSENIPSTSSEPQEQIKETTCDKPVLEKEVAVQCKLQCQNCLKLENKKRRYRNLYLGAKHKLQCSRTYASSSNMDILVAGKCFLR